MSLDTPVATREKTRVFVTGTCDGLAELRDALERHGEVEIVGWSDTVLDSASTLTGGHLQVVLHGTRSSTLPHDELAAIREHSPAPVILLASGESSVLLEEALDADVSDVLLLPQMTENVVFAIRKASHSGRKAAGGQGRRGRIVTVFSPKGGTGKTVTTTNLASAFAKYEGKKALLLDLDLSLANLPIGSTLRIGAARLEVTPKPHNGCVKFRRRFGADALRFVSAPPLRALNLRGIYLRVVEEGEAAVGDPVVVVSR